MVGADGSGRADRMSDPGEANLQAGRGRRPWLPVALLLLAVAVGAPGIRARERPDSAVRIYDIPAQPLEAALKAFIATSRMQLFYETTLTSGQWSAGVSGTLNADVALQRLLAGTGLAVRRAEKDAFFLVSTLPERTAASSPSTWNPDFLAALQAAVVDAMCRNARTRPGDYKAALELWIGPSGAVERGMLLGSTGDAGRDAALMAVVTRATVALPPPPGTPQPIVLVVAPRPPRDSGDCAAAR